MLLKYLLVSDYALRSEEGKTSILGIFDRINTPSNVSKDIPLVFPSLCIIFQIQDLPDSFEGSATLKIEHEKSKDRIFNENIKIVLKEGSNNFNGIVHIGMLAFKEFGKYDVSLVVGQELIGQTVLSVNKV